MALGLAAGIALAPSWPWRAAPPARNPGGRDRAARARARGVALEGFAHEPPVRTAPPSPLGRLEAARTRFAELASGRMPAEEAGLVRALGAGDVSALAPSTQE